MNDRMNDAEGPVKALVYRSVTTPCSLNLEDLADPAEKLEHPKP